MSRAIHPKNSNTDRYFEDIKICPICKYSIIPKYISSYTHNNESSLSLYCECTHCSKPFIAYFPKADKNFIFTNPEYLAPEKIDTISFDKTIEDFSPNFVSIYNEAHSAEVYHLDNIAGMGYRKALEFLIKDYCILKNPDKVDEIKSALLGQVISKYIDSDKIKNLTKASTWLGNDQTHYTRKFEDKDITDLKRFISATVAFITYELISEEANSFISES